MLLMATAERIRQDGEYGWPATIEDLEAVPGAEGHRYELIDGDIVVTPPAGEWHQDVAHLLSVALDPVCEERGLAVRQNRGILLPEGMVIPDVVVYRADRPAIRDIYLSPEDVILAVEVVSHSSRRMDRFRKPAALAAADIPLYLLVDPFPRPVRLTLFALDDDSYDQVARVEPGTPLHLPDPFDVDLDTSRLG